MSQVCEICDFMKFERNLTSKTSHPCLILEENRFNEICTTFLKCFPERK